MIEVIILYIMEFLNLKCHSCLKNIKHPNFIYKKQDKFYYCSEECYYFI